MPLGFVTEPDSFREWVDDEFISTAVQLDALRSFALAAGTANRDFWAHAIKVQVVLPLPGDLDAASQVVPEDVWLRSIRARITPYLDFLWGREERDLSGPLSRYDRPDYEANEGSLSIAEETLLCEWLSVGMAKRTMEDAGGQICQPVVHSECSLVYYLYGKFALEKQKDPDLTVIHYIGTSTPPCYACCRMMRAAALRVRVGDGENVEFGFLNASPAVGIHEGLFFLPAAKVGSGNEWEVRLRERMLLTLYSDLGEHVANETAKRVQELDQEREEMGSEDNKEGE